MDIRVLNRIVKEVLSCDSIEKYQTIHEYIFNEIVPYLRQNNVNIENFKQIEVLTVFENEQIRVKLNKCTPMNVYQITVIFKIYKIRIIAFYTIENDVLIPYICDK